MSRITYTDSERKLMACLSIRRTQILKKLARLIGAENLKEAEHAVSAEDLIGKGYDHRDALTMLKTLSTMGKTVKEVYLRHGAYFITFSKRALSILRKMALQAVEYPKDGDGEMYCEAVLSLKRALGVRSAVWYNIDFDNESFNYGEDAAYLDSAFESDAWIAGFNDKPGEFVSREIEIRPMEEGKIGIVQTLRHDWPESELDSSNILMILPRADFINPDALERFLPEIAKRAKAPVLEFIEKSRDALFVELEDKTVSSRPEILARMKKACEGKDALCGLFRTFPEIRQSPEWPLGLEPKAFFREYSLGFKDFMERHAERFQWTVKADAENFAASLWLSLFERKYGMKPGEMDIDDYGKSGCAEIFREKFPKLAPDINAEYEKELEKAEIRIAWGLLTKNFKTVMGFVNGVISHPDMEKMELSHIGWSFSRGMDENDLRKCLGEAIDSALPLHRAQIERVTDNQPADAQGKPDEAKGKKR